MSISQASARSRRRCPSPTGCLLAAGARTPRQAVELDRSGDAGQDSRRHSHPDSNGHAGEAPGRDLPASRPDLHRVDDAVAASSRSMPSRRPAPLGRGSDRRPVESPAAGRVKAARPRFAGEPAGPAPRSMPRPHRSALCRPSAAPVVRWVKFTRDCRRDLRRIVANVEGAAVLKCGRCFPSKRPCPAGAGASAMGQ